MVDLKRLLMAMAMSNMAIAGPTLHWDEVLNDTNGNLFDITAVQLEYSIYTRPQGSVTPATFVGNTVALEYDISAAPLGCHEYYATAKRLDTTPPLESTESNVVVVCDSYFSLPLAPFNLRVIYD